MNETTFWQLYDTLRKRFFTQSALYLQLTLIVRTHARVITTLGRSQKKWKAPTRYFIKKADQQDFISRDKNSGKWGVVCEGKVVPLWSDEELSEILADPKNLVVIPFFNLMDSLLFYLIAA